MFFFFFFGFSKLIENFQTRSYPRFKSFDSQTYAALQIFWQSQNYVLMIKIYICTHSPPFGCFVNLWYSNSFFFF